MHPPGLLAAGQLPPLTTATALQVWQFAPEVSTALLLLAAGYLGGMRRVRKRHPARPWPAGRTIAFFTGLAVIALATQSSIGAYDDVLFSVHMVQHILLIMVAPPLLVLGRPVTLALHAYGQPVHGWIKTAVRSRLVTALTWPPAIAVAYCAVVAGTHLTPLMNLVEQYPALHDGEHVLYLVTGYLFFLPIIGSEPIKWRIPAVGRLLMLLAVMPADTLTGLVLMLVPHELFPVYAHTWRTWGPSPLADLHDGGIIMWVGSDSVMTILALVMCVLLFRDARPSSLLGPWVEGIRRTGVRRRITTAGLALPQGDDVDDSAHLAAYNAAFDNLREDPHGQA
jgi:putative copper resistance protein D